MDWRFSPSCLPDAWTSAAGRSPNVEGFSTPDAPKVVPLEQNYRIAPLDTLSIRVFKMTDLTGDYEVDLTGKISMPLIGEMSAVDLTTAELDQRLTARLGEYLENPDISVGIVVDPAQRHG